jgi:predicted lactoylglutathione lyase
MAADTNIFVNLPVKDLNRSQEFFGALGFTFNPQFTDENAACMIIGEKIFSMLITEQYFTTFTPKKIADARTTSEVLIALSCGSREEVGEMVQKAVAAGGKTYNEAKDHGFMLQHGFEDPDGHIWEVFYMDPSFVQ